MDPDHGTGFHLDPLGEIEVQRALALARARENYPAVPRDTLLGYCEAAWEVALRADPRRRDMQGSFDRALLIIAWTQRRSGGRVPMRDLVDQTIPRIALEPFISERVPPLVAEEAVTPDAPVEAVPPARRSLLRVPLISPMPVGAVLAAGLVGVAVLNETEVLPIAPLQPAGSQDSDPSDAAAQRGGGDEVADSGSDGASGGAEGLSAGLLSEGVAQATEQALAPTGTAEVAEAGGGSGEAGGQDDLATAGEPRVADAPAADDSVASVASEQPVVELVPATPVAVVPPPAPRPVVRIEMPPPTMILEVSTPPSRTDVEDDDDESDAGQRGESDTGPDTRGRTESDRDEDRRGRSDLADEDRNGDRRAEGDEAPGPVDVFEKAVPEDLEDEDEDEDEDAGEGEGEGESLPSAPVAPAPAEPAPAMPAPAPPLTEPAAPPASGPPPPPPEADPAAVPPPA